MTDLSIFRFGDRELRVSGDGDNPLFVLKDVCNCLELQNPSDVAKRLDDDEKGVDSIYTPSGNQEMIVVTEPGLYRVALGCRKPQAKPFQRWVTHEVLPAIRKTGSYSIQPQTPAELLLQSVQMLVEQERRIAQQQAQLNQNTQAIAQIQQTQQDAQQHLNALPPATVKVPPKTTRALISETVRGFSMQTGTNFRDNWNQLYREFRQRYHIDLVIRATNANKRPLDIAEELGMLEELYALAVELFIASEEAKENH